MSLKPQDSPIDTHEIELQPEKIQSPRLEQSPQIQVIDQEPVYESLINWNKFKQNAKIARTSLIKEVFRVGIYLVVAIGVFYAFEKRSHISLHEETYFSSEQVVYQSEIRGLFPPIQGQPQKLLGRWHIPFTNSLQISNTDIYNSYTLEFKANSVLRVKRKGCQGDFMLKVATFQYNIFIEQPSPREDSEMSISGDEKDIQCIKGELKFIQYLKSASVWTYYDGHIYILVEMYQENTLKQSILLLQQVQ